MLRFLKVDAGVACAKIVDELSKALEQNERVLWIVPGGSNIPLIAKIMRAIPEAGSKRLAIMLSDERFGPVGHKDSNLQQLYEAGFEPKRATVVPVLRPEADLDETVKLYGEAAQTAFAAASTIIIQLGMGADGHMAGILPGSAAARSSKQWALAYETPEFTRLTLTPFALKQADKIFVVAYGAGKRSALVDLRDKKLPVSRQPAQLVKSARQVVIINNQIGGKQ